MRGSAKAMAMAIVPLSQPGQASSVPVPNIVTAPAAAAVVNSRTLPVVMPQE